MPSLIRYAAQFPVPLAKRDEHFKKGSGQVGFYACKVPPPGEQILSFLVLHVRILLSLLEKASEVAA